MYVVSIFFAVCLVFLLVFIFVFFGVFFVLFGFCVFFSSTFGLSLSGDLFFCIV